MVFAKYLWMSTEQKRIMGVQREIFAGLQRPRQTANKSKFFLYLVRIIWNIDSQKSPFSRIQALYYSLHQKKRRFNPFIFPGDPGSLTLTQGHVNFVKFTLTQKKCDLQKPAFLLGKSVGVRPGIS